jgi:hypothetical protein
MSAVQTTPIQVDIESLLTQHAGEQLEFRRRIHSADALADLIASFAHTAGGTIIVGYDPRRRRPVGCNPDRLELVHKRAEVRLGHPAISKLTFHHVKGRELGRIDVPQVDRLITSPRGLPVRRANKVVAMTKEMIVTKLQNARQRLGAEDFGTMLTGIAANLVSIRGVSDRDHTLWAKLKDQALGAVIGTVVGAGLTALAALVLRYFGV